MRPALAMAHSILTCTSSVRLHASTLEKQVVPVHLPLAACEAAEQLLSSIFASVHRGCQKIVLQFAYVDPMLVLAWP